MAMTQSEYDAVRARARAEGYEGKGNIPVDVVHKWLEEIRRQAPSPVVRLAAQESIDPSLPILKQKNHPCRTQHKFVNDKCVKCGVIGSTRPTEKCKYCGTLIPVDLLIGPDRHETDFSF